MVSERSFPQLNPVETAELCKSLDEVSSNKFDFYFTMAFSTALASLGLLQDSVPVVIGAMIVAPLMNPLLTAGLALVLGDAGLFSKGMRITVCGIAFGFVVSLIFGIINPGFEPTMEIEARGRPDILDLIIALVSGMTAAYALSRKDVVNIIAGVAIAAALIPPLSVVGLSVAGREYDIAGNAAILLVTNLVAIVLGASAMFRLLGANEIHGVKGSTKWVRKAVMILALISVLLAAPLFMTMVRKMQVGQNRPLTYPVSPKVRNAVIEYLQDWPDVEVIMMARYSTEPKTSMAILLVTEEKLPVKFEKGLRESVLDIRSDFPEINIFVMESAIKLDD